MTESEMNSYLDQRRRQHRIDEYAASIQQPGEEVAGITVDEHDIEALATALATALETCTPFQVARWFYEVLHVQTTVFNDDERLWPTDDDEWRSENEA